jgi:hypothetical protein
MMSGKQILLALTLVASFENGELAILIFALLSSHTGRLSGFVTFHRIDGFGCFFKLVKIN